MATYSTDLSTLTTAESGTWVELTGTILGFTLSGAGGPAADGENYIQGTDCRSQTTGKAVDAEISIAFNNGSGYSFATDEVVFGWCYYAVGVNLKTKANSGWMFVICDSLTTGDYFVIGGSDSGRNPYGGWMNVAIDPTATQSGTLGAGGNSGTYQYFGQVCNTLNEISKGTPSAVDAIRAGRGVISVTGTGGSFSELAEYNDYNGGSTPPGTSSTSVDSGRHRLGLFQASAGTYLWKGLLSLGTSGTSVTFSDSNTTIIIDDCPHTYAAFNLIEINNASSSVTLTNVSVVSTASTTNGIGYFEMVANATVVMEGCLFVDMGTFIFLSNGDAENCTWVGCEMVTGGGGLFNGSKVLTSTVAADASAFSWNIATDPDGYLDDMVFSQGTADHHAITFGTNTPSTININGIDFQGFNAADAHNGSALYFPDTGSDVAWVVNATGCTGNIKYKKVRSGDTVTVNLDQVSHTLTGLINGSEVTYMKRGTAIETGSIGATTVGSREFNPGTGPHTVDAYKGHLLYITSGSDAGRYYCYGNASNLFYLDTAMTTTASSLTYELYDENDDTEVFHVESVTGNQSQHTYTYTADQDVDITVIATYYEQVVLEDVTLGNTSQSIPISQIYDNNYFNP
jgi:hypothetical protein